MRISPKFILLLLLALLLVLFLSTPVFASGSGEVSVGAYVQSKGRLDAYRVKEENDSKT